MGARFLLALAGLLLSFSTLAADLRIRYAEAVQLRAAAAPGMSKPGGSRAVEFTAYGRGFQLELQLNQRLLSSLSKKPGITLYKGALTGVASSWVRLTEIDEQFSGAIWDGEQLYLLASAQEAAASLIQPTTAGTNDTLIFRIADTEGGALGGICASTGAAGNGSSYGALLAELKGRRPLMQAATIGGEIEVSLLADAHFSSLNTADAIARMIARMNVVDGIFAEQLGILITPVHVTKLDSDNDPFTGTDAIDLLEQLSSYRAGRPELQTSGVTHLMTGRDLDGSTIGIAYLGAVCDIRHGVSLSESRSGDVTAPLIIAHEIGHNFGAPHDNVPESVCTSTPGTFLMSPSLNGSDDFSACSLQQMQARISSASCVLSPYIDVGVQSAPTGIEASPGELIHIPVTVAADRRDVTGVQLTASGFSNVTVESVSPVEGGTCAVTSSGVECALGDLPANATRSFSIAARVNPSLEYSFSSNISLYVRAPDDRDSANNNHYIPINVSLRGDAGVSVTQSTLSATRGESVSLPTISIVGVRTLENATLDVSLPANVSVTISPGNCYAQSGGLRCDLGLLRAGTSLELPISLRFSSAGSSTIGLQLSASGDEDASNNTSSIAATVTEPASTNVGGGQSSGGGGGGALGWQALLGLLMLLVARRARDRR